MSSAERYRPNRFVSLPAELDRSTFDVSPERRRAEAERLAIRARLKRQYQLQLNNPNPPPVIVSGDGGAATGKRGACPQRPMSRSGALAWCRAGGGLRCPPRDLGVLPGLSLQAPAAGEGDARR